MPRIDIDADRTLTYTEMTDLGSIVLGVARHFIADQIEGRLQYHAVKVYFTEGAKGEKFRIYVVVNDLVNNAIYLLQAFGNAKYISAKARDARAGKGFEYDKCEACASVFAAIALADKKVRNFAEFDRVVPVEVTAVSTELADMLGAEEGDGIPDISPPTTAGYQPIQASTVPAVEPAPVRWHGDW